MAETKIIKGWHLPSSEKHFEDYLLHNKDAIATGQYQKIQRDIALSHVKSFRRAIDIGACVGFWSRDLCEQFSHVECFEPYDEPLNCLRLNLAGKDNCTTHQIALSDKSGTAILSIDESGIGHSSIVESEVTATKKIKTKLTKLDSFNFTDIDFIKIDVQFHELNVLRGARKTLERNSPVLCVECGRRTSEEYIYVSRVIEYLYNLGYEIAAETGKEIIFKKEGKPRSIRHFEPLLRRLTFIPFT
ncbi:FkbM family methyltransferase [uncultured Roseibium sp.]|uniref:FkbM family methyltransferase n=1 Tax=uncultured Roseibium sp. TaxID=1936171 RepID=UPI003217F45D